MLTILLVLPFVLPVCLDSSRPPGVSFWVLVVAGRAAPVSAKKWDLRILCATLSASVSDRAVSGGLAQGRRGLPTRRVDLAAVCG